MRVRGTLLCLVVAFALQSRASGAPFVVFPKAAQLPSPDGRFVVVNRDREAPMSQYVGTFHFLELLETATGRTRELCDYVGVASVGWSSSDRIIVTQYVSKRTSRALVFTASDSREPVVIDKSFLTTLVPVELRPHLRENDRVFVEASRVEGEILALHVWGYGQHDANGFSWNCDYNLLSGDASCQEEKRQ